MFGICKDNNCSKQRLDSLLVQPTQAIQNAVELLLELFISK